MWFCSLLIVGAIDYNFPLFVMACALFFFILSFFLSFHCHMHYIFFAFLFCLSVFWLFSLYNCYQFKPGAYYIYILVFSGRFFVFLPLQVSFSFCSYHCFQNFLIVWIQMVSLSSSDLFVISFLCKEMVPTNKFFFPSVLYICLYSALPAVPLFCITFCYSFILH